MEVLECCRCCLSKDSATKSINSYVDTGGRLGQVKEIMSDCLNIKADIDDGLSEKVCVPCVAILKKICSFRKRVLQSYKCLSEKQNEIKQQKEQTNVEQEDVTNPQNTTFSADIEIEVSTDYKYEDNEKSKEIFGYGVELEAEEGEENSECDADNIDDSNYNQDLKEPLPASVQLFYCILCEEKFEKREQLYKHCCDVHKPLNKSGKACEYCNERSVYASVLALHKRKHLTPFVCPWCNMKFSSDSEYDIHSQRCDKYAKSTEKIEQRKTQRKGKFKKGYVMKRESCQCHYCGKSYDKGYIRSHMKIHEEGKYVCKYCGKVFHQSSPYKQHVNVHLRLKRLQCLQCEKTFACRNYLDRHVAVVHIKKKNFFCDFCGKGFFSRENFTSHVLSHTGLRPIACHLCDKSYLDKCGLTSHLKKHHKIKPKSRTIQPVVTETSQ